MKSSGPRGGATDVDPENLGSNTAPNYGFNYISLEDVDLGILRSYSEQLLSTAPSRARRKLQRGVGGWNCDKNGKSRDAVVILDAERKLVGKPWRGNLRTAINAAADGTDWIKRLFDLCKAVPPSHPLITLAIDTPLGFSDVFTRMVTRLDQAGEIGSSVTSL